MSENCSGQGGAKVIVCVTELSSCRRLIRVGKSIAAERGVEVLNIQPSGQQDLLWIEALEEFYSAAREEAVPLSVHYNDMPALAAAAHISRCEATDIVVGIPDPGTTNYFIAILHTLLPNVTIHMADGQGRVHRLQSQPVSERSLSENS